MRQLHRVLVALAMGAIFSSGVLLASLGLALAQEPDLQITFPVEATYTEENWNAGCDSIGFCGTVTDGVTGSGVQISIQLGEGNFYWHDDITDFATGSEVFFPALGFEGWTFAFPFVDFPADGEYTVHARATDNLGNVEASRTATFTINIEPPVSPPVSPPSGPGIKEGKPRGFVGVVDVIEGSEPSESFTLIRQGTGELVEIHRNTSQFLRAEGNNQNVQAFHPWWRASKTPLRRRRHWRL